MRDEPKPREWISGIGVVTAPAPSMPSPARTRRLYRLLDWAQGSSVTRRLDEALARQTWTPDALERDATKRLADLLEHARREVPFWEQRLRGLSTDGAALTGPGFRAIPPLEKAEIRAGGGRLRRRGAVEGDPRIRVVTSGGTTGAPTRIEFDRDAADAQTAAALRCHLWFGADPTLRHVMVWGPPPDENTYAHLAGRLKGFVLGRSLLESFGLDDTRARQLYERVLAAGRLEFVTGYSSALVRLAAAARPDEVARVRVAVVPAAEPIFDFQRPAIQRAFGAPLRDRYGCNEFSALAHDCVLGRLHVCTDRVRLEILRDDGAPASRGEIGEVLVTDLDNFHMPLIRYRIGDLAAWSDDPCPCGLPFPLLERVHGRTRDRLADSAGRPLSPHAFAAALDGTPAREFQLRVDAERRVRRVDVAAEPFPLDEARARWMALAGGEVETRFVREIVRSKNGKVLPVIGLGD